MSASSTDDAPTVAIRTKPPSPKRLSRKVLLGCAALATAVISFSLVSGLQPRARMTAQAQQSPASTTAAPQSVTEASSQYDARELGAHDASAIQSVTTAPNSLAPPQDGLWNGSPSASGAGASTTTSDPEASAYASPILFTSAAEHAGQAAPTHADQNARLDAVLSPPHSPYEVQAGSVIPAALVTGLNSDAPGRVIAQVTAPVFDSVTGEHLLIPQGARLLGVYDNGVHYGDGRVVLVWDRLILPNGWSIDLSQMNGADPTGASGIADRTDNHLWRLGGAVGLSAIISVIADNAQNDRQSQSLTQSLGDAAAQQAAQTGGRIVDRELAVHPTLTVRPGANVRVLVTRDIELRPYTPRGGDGNDRAP